MKLNISIILAFLALALVQNNLSAQRSASIKTEEISTFYIDAITLSNDSTPRKIIDINSNVNNTLSKSYYVNVNNRNVIVYAEDGYKAELMNISGLTIQLKTIINGKSNFNVKTPGVYLVKISSKYNKTTLLKTIVI
jgi:hypothetical protein